MAVKNEPIKLIITIAERGKGRSITELYAENQISCHYQCFGRGTASSDLLDVIGLDGSERDVMLSFAAESLADQMMYRLKDELRDQIDSTGIIFDLALSGVNNILATILTMQAQEDGTSGGTTMEQNKDHSMILVIVNQGTTDDVMNTARAAGARGGTVIRSRWAGTEEDHHFFGVSFQGEKELILIVAEQDKRNTIMETVNMKHGMKTEAGAIICSMGIDHMLTLG